MKRELVQALNEMNQAYPVLLNSCQKLLRSAFELEQQAEFREEIMHRAKRLKNKTVERKVTSFVNAAADDEKDDKSWLEAIAMVVSDKPTVEWSDQDLLVFETQLADISRRFSNLEAIQHELKKIPADTDGKQAKRVVVADTQGNEFNQVVWISPEDEGKVTELVDELLSKTDLEGNLRLQKAFFAGLSERLFQVKTQ